MKCLYPVETELIKDARGDTSKFKMTPKIIHLCAKIAKFSKLLIKVSSDFSKKNIKIKSYDGNTFDATLYTPKLVDKKSPCLIYYPGGGFVVGAYPYMHTLAMLYSKYVNCKILFVNYRLSNAPCYTATIEDSYIALKYVWENADELDVDKNKIAVIGDSAGATLATVVSIMSRDRNGPKIKFQMLIYPMTMYEPKTWTRQNYYNTPGMNSDWVNVFLEEAIKNGLPEKKEYISPLDIEDFTCIPPAYIETEEFCPLRDEGDLYARKLTAHGIPVIHNQVRGTFHAFDSSLKRALVKKIIYHRSEILKKALE